MNSGVINTIIRIFYSCFIHGCPVVATFHWPQPLICFWNDGQRETGLSVPWCLWVGSNLSHCCPDLPSCIPRAEILERSLVSNPGFTASSVHLGWSWILHLQTKNGFSPIPLFQSETHTHTHRNSAKSKCLYLPNSLVFQHSTITTLECKLLFSNDPFHGWAVITAVVAQLI